MTGPVVHLDVETRSTVNLKTAGLYRYFEDPTTEVTILRWGFSGATVREGIDQELIGHIARGGVVTGHNITFDREAWNVKIAGLRDLPFIKIEQTDDTMARAAAIALPQSLDAVGKAVNAKIGKDAAGHRLMLQMCKPRKIESCADCEGRGHGPEEAPLGANYSYVEGCNTCHGSGQIVTWWDDEERMKRLGDYCTQDVIAEQEIDRVLPPLPKQERRVWELDQKINARGVKLDMAMVSKALAVAELATKNASKRIEVLTGGAVKKVTEVAKIVAWLNARGVPCDSLAKGEIEEILIRTDVFEDVEARQVVELRRAAAKSSVAKYKAMENSVCRDSRVRGTLNYHGAATGRWAGRLIQPQNLPRILHWARDVELLHNVLRRNADPAIAFNTASILWDNPLEILSRALRSMIVAEDGHRLLGGDYANIEGRVNAWLSGEEWKVKAFAAFDRGSGGDLYKIAYGRAFHLAAKDVTDSQRQIGKVMELAMGYQGGVKAFHKMAAIYNITVTNDRANLLKQSWRNANPAIVEGWWQLQDAAIEAVMSPGMKVPVYDGRCTYLCKHNVLWCKLPSGRRLAYANPTVVWRSQKIEVDGEEVETQPRRTVQYQGVDSFTKKWGIRHLYGGHQCENIVQAVARDILVEGMLNLEEAGYPLVLTVHDENIAEVPDGFGSVDEFRKIMSVVPAWAEGLPVAVEAWEGPRYVK